MLCRSFGAKVTSHRNLTDELYSVGFLLECERNCSLTLPSWNKKISNLFFYFIRTYSYEDLDIIVRLLGVEQEFWKGYDLTVMLTMFQVDKESIVLTIFYVSLVQASDFNHPLA